MDLDHTNLSFEWLCGLTFMCIISVVACIMYGDTLPSLDGLRKKVRNSVASVDMVAKAFVVIRNWNENSLTPGMYAMIEKDSQRAMALLQTYEEEEQQIQTQLPENCDKETKRAKKSKLQKNKINEM